ncbi:MAG TPA: HAD family acid phosphatase [Ignavibacteriaceae bacterium]|nr:HAD family acid phosphatase [Ignavibacteriaceae bacterium]
MKFNFNIWSILYITLSLILFFACDKNEKPVNLTVARNEVKQYYESGKYDEELNKVITDAKKEFEKVEFKESAKGGSVVIFDIDETALNNYGLAKQMGFGYVYEMNKQWNAELKAPAIKQVKELYEFLLSKGAKIIFLTGRNFYEYEVTYQNLVKEGYTVFDTLITQIGDETKMKAKDFKSGKRVWLTKQGYDIAGTVGDQWSDLQGYYHGIQIKIPNYLYLIED